MIRVQGNNNVKPIECVNPMRNKWRIHWDIQISTNESGAQEASYMEHEFTHRPTIEEVKNIITNSGKTTKQAKYSPLCRISRNSRRKTLLIPNS